MLYAGAAADPDKTALIFGARRCSYQALDQASNRTANALISSAGSRRGVIGIIGKNSDYFIEILFGVVKSGGTALPLNWRLAPAELKAVAEDANLAMLFYDIEFAGVIDDLKQAMPAIAYIPFDGIGGTPQTYQTFVQDFSTARPKIAISPDDPAIMMYTSGTTGKPKGVPASHFAICFAPENMLATGPRCISLENDINLLTTPLFHLAGIGWLHGAIFAYATLVILPTADIPGVIGAIAAHRVTRATILPAR